ncbi:MAG: ABC transporter permease [Spirochaetota bacterium]|nr:MAG: ABC transporter permease [Spirochaetota bacterium]
MKLKLAFFLAKRYLMAKWSLMSTLSILMISFGVITLITVLSIMNGFHSTFKKKILETNTYHLMIQPSFGESYSLNNIKSFLSKNKEIISVVPYYNGEGILKSRWITRGIILKAFPHDVLQVDAGFKREIKVTEGEFDLSGEDSIMLGHELAIEAGARIGDYVPVLTFRGEDISIVKPTFKLFKVVGFFKTGYWEYDKNMVYISLNAAYKIFGITPQDLEIGIKVQNIYRVDRVIHWIQNNTDKNFYILTWMDINRPLFDALQNEKVGIGFVVMLIIVSGAFNIIGSLVMTVMDKKREIGILRALGAKPSLITQVFVLDGFYIGIVGTMIGVFTGFFLTLNIEKIINLIERIVNGLRDIVYFLYLIPYGIPAPANFEILSDSIYYLEGVPVEIHFKDVFIISILAVLISVLAAYYPAKKASLMKHVYTIRNE